MSEIYSFEKPDGTALEIEAPSREAAIKAYNRMRGEAQSPSGFMAFANRGISQVLGLPGDVVNAASEAMGFGAHLPGS